jgi:hypothetical protein
MRDPPSSFLELKSSALRESSPSRRTLVRDRQAIRRLGEVQGQQSAGVRDWRIFPRQPLDALIVGYYEGDKLIFVSKVRNGFAPGFVVRCGLGWKTSRQIIARSPIFRRNDVPSGL